MVNTVQLMNNIQQFFTVRHVECRSVIHVMKLNMLNPMDVCINYRSFDKVQSQRRITQCKSLVHFIFLKKVFCTFDDKIWQCISSTQHLHSTEGGHSSNEISLKNSRNSNSTAPLLGDIQLTSSVVQKPIVSSPHQIQMNKGTANRDKRTQVNTEQSTKPEPDLNDTLFLIDAHERLTVRTLHSLSLIHTFFSLLLLYLGQQWRRVHSTSQRSF